MNDRELGKRADSIRDLVERYRPEGRDEAADRSTYLFLARHFEGDAIRFGDVRPIKRDHADGRSGEIVLITTRAVVHLRYDGAHDHGRLPVSVKLELYRLQDVKSLTISNADVRAQTLAQGGQQLHVDTVRIAGDNWELKLPGEYIDDGDTYLDELRSALGLA